MKSEKHHIVCVTRPMVIRFYVAGGISRLEGKLTETKMSPYFNNNI